MDRTEMLPLMHAVLDGVASSEERAALDRVLAQDPQARTQFAELQRLFGALDGMPRVEPPEGFADDVMAALQRSTAKGASTHQPFAQSGVIGPTGSDIRVRAPSKPITARTPSGPMWGRQDMSKRGYWIMGGVAAAVLALFVGTSVDFPASGDKAAGTIVPAERVRAAQPSADDVKLGRPASRASPGAAGTAGDRQSNPAAGNGTWAPRQQRTSVPRAAATVGVDGNATSAQLGNSRPGRAGNSSRGGRWQSRGSAARPGNSNGRAGSATSAQLATQRRRSSAAATSDAAGSSNLGASWQQQRQRRQSANHGRGRQRSSAAAMDARQRQQPAAGNATRAAAATSARRATATSVRRATATWVRRQRSLGGAWTLGSRSAARAWTRAYTK